MNTSRCIDTGECSYDGMMISRKKQKTLGENQLQCHSIHRASQTNSPGNETKTFKQEASLK
jgi:hypothetical protein